MNIKALLIALTAVAMPATAAWAQDDDDLPDVPESALIYSIPNPLQMSSQDVVVYYRPNLGNGGLAGSRPNQTIYAHTGVITNQSANDGDWQYDPKKWGDNDEKYALEYIDMDLWALNIGTIAEYYGITDPSVVVKKLAFVFRNEDCTKEGKTASNGDIFLTVAAEGFSMNLTSSLGDNKVLTANEEVTYTANTTAAATITLSINGKQVAQQTGTTSLSYTTTVTQTGDYLITANATSADGSTATDQLMLCCPSASTAQAYPGGVPQMGATRNADGTVTFCLMAPQKSQVILVPSWDNYDVKNANVMHYQDYNGYRYFWTTTTQALDPNSMYPYYYLVDGIYSVGDPYAKLVLDPWNDKYISADVYPNLPAYPSDRVNNVSLAVYYENINKYNWQVTDFKGVDKDNLIIYELLLRDFTGTEGQADANGTVKAAIEKIPYIKSLGCNAIELLPINEFNGNISWGYNPNFYFAPDKIYGTPNDYKQFIDECHRQGIAVILDIVFNQTDWQHPWYQMYEVGSNPFYNATAPHAYSVLNDWNQGYEPVQMQFHDVLRYWLEEYKVDGYRFDLVKGLGDNSSYASASDAATNAYNQSRIDRMHALQEVVLAVNPNAYFINENLAEAAEENAMAVYGQLNWSNINDPACQFAMGYSSGSGMQGMYAPNYSRTWGSTVSYCESHDEQRVAYKQDQWGVTGVKGNLQTSMRRIGCNAAQMLLSPGAHMIWMFSELGDAQNAKSANGDNNTSPKEVLWSYFDVPDRHGLYEDYAALAWLRNSNPDLFAKTATFSSKCTESDWANGRFLYASTANKEMICVINPNVSGSAKAFTATFKQADSSKYRIQAKSYQSSPSFSAENGTVTVEPNCFVVLVSENVDGIETPVTDAEAATAVYYNLMGQPVAEPQPGNIYIQVVGGKASKVIMH